MEQLKGAIGYYIDLMGGKLDALNTQFESAQPGGRRRSRRSRCGAEGGGGDTEENRRWNCRWCGRYWCWGGWRGCKRKERCCGHEVLEGQRPAQD
jgi:hypothetical protein